MFCKKGVLSFAKSTGKHLCQSLFFNKVAFKKPATLFKKRLWHRCFPVNFAKFLRTPILKNICKLLLRSHTYCRHWFLHASKISKIHYNLFTLKINVISLLFLSFYIFNTLYTSSELSYSIPSLILFKK